MSLRNTTASFEMRRAGSRARECSSMRAMRMRSMRKVRGFTLVELLVVISIIGMLMALLLPAINSARETGRQNTCRSNLSNLALAMIQYDGRLGRYPGYMNVLRTHRGDAYKDPTTGTVTPVSWAVELLPDLDRIQLYDQWRTDISGSGGGGGGGSGGSGSFIANTKIFLEILTCPSDDTNRQGTPTSYVVNSGQKDAPQSIPGNTASGSGTPSVGIPRDWKANGVYFDYYSDDPLIKTTAAQRVPIVVMRSGEVLDPKDKTIMLTENVDATDYTFDVNNSGGALFPYAEVQLGCVWDGLATIQQTQSTGGAPSTVPPMMTPTMDQYRINYDVGKGDGVQYQYCRPSSRHPQGINVAFVGKNVVFLRESISYFVYAKLMASNDSGIKLAGGTTIPDQSLLKYQMTDADLNP